MLRRVLSPPKMSDDANRDTTDVVRPAISSMGNFFLSSIMKLLR